LCVLSLLLPISAAPQEPEQPGWGYAPSNQGDAAHFLEYATWGPTWTDVNYLLLQSYASYLEQQLAAPMSSYPTLPLVSSTRPADCVDTCQRDNYTLWPLQTRFFTNALYGPDQLRQRVAFALHQIIVVSGVEITLPSRLAPYLQVLDRNALGNYRTLLQEITLNPAMGNYLDMAGNTATNPNENYAREILQLFTIGLYKLNQDGTPVLDGNGQPIPAYEQNDVNSFARVFTGWNFAAAPAPGIVNYIDPLVATESRHDTKAKTLLNGVTLPANQKAAKDLSDGLDNIFQHPNLPPFVSKQLIQHLVTSNPSPAYVRRVADVFVNDGSGVRGNLARVVLAILLDPEAAANPAPEVGKGHLKHPVLMVTSLLREFDAKSADGLGLSDGYLNPQNQSMGMDLFNPPSVFSYFSPATGVPGSALKGPEFGVFNTSTAIKRANFVNTMVFSRVAVSANAPTGTSLDLAPWSSLADNPDLMVYWMSSIMMSGRVTPSMTDAIVTAVKAVPSNNPLQRVKTAVYLIATSAQYQVSR